jgi:hypothetical protein
MSVTLSDVERDGAAGAREDDMGADFYTDEQYFTDSENYAAENAIYFATGRPVDDDCEPDLTADEERELNDVRHLLDCACPKCLREAYDPAEQFAGQPDWRVA